MKRTIRKGIDDLLIEFAFRGSSQGDETVTNNVQEYISSNGWLIPIIYDPLIDIMDQKQVDLEIERRRTANKAYIERLKLTGEYGKEVVNEMTVYLKHNPLFDR